MKRILIKTLLLLLIALPAIAQPQTGTINIVDDQGRKQGFWKKIVNDTLKYEGTFKDDIPLGEFKYYYYSGTIKSVVQYSEKGLMAKTVTYYENGKKLAEGEYWDKKKHGLWKYYSTEGFLTAIEDYHNAIKEGEWITYFHDGKPAEIKHYTAGKANGEFITFFPDSIINIKGNYVNDKIDGQIYYYYLSGTVMVSGTIKEDLKEGIWMYFNEKGQTDKRLTFSQSNLIKEEINILGPDKKTAFLDINKIAYVFSSNNEVKIRMNDGTDYISVRPMDDFQHVLSEYKFFRVNANYIIALWSISNRATYSTSEKLLLLKPESPTEVFIADNVAEGFLHWAGLIKGEVDPKNPDNFK